MVSVINEQADKRGQTIPEFLGSIVTLLVSLFHMVNRGQCLHTRCLNLAGNCSSAEVTPQSAPPPQGPWQYLRELGTLL